MYKLHLILKYLRKRRIAWVSLVAVMLCTAMVLVVISVMGGWLRMFRESFHGLSGDVIVHGRSLAGFPFYEEMVERIEKLPEIEAAVPTLRAYGLIDINNYAHEGVQVLGFPDDIGRVNKFVQSLHRQYELSDDKSTSHVSFALLPEIRYEVLSKNKNVLKQPGMIVGAGVVGIGKNEKGEVERPPRLNTWYAMLTVLPVSDEDVKIATAELLPTTYWIVDDSRTQIYQYDSNTVYVPFAQLQKDLKMEAFQGEPARTSDIQIKVKPGVSLALAKAKIEDIVTDVFQSKGIIADNRIIVETWEESQAIWLGAIEKEKALVTFLFSLISVVAIFLIFCIFYMIVVEKTRDIGIIKSVGATSGGVAGIFLGYGLAIGIVGGGLGLLGGYLIVHNINYLHTKMGELMGIHIWDPQVYAFDTIPNTMDSKEVVVIIAVAILSSVLGALVPAIRAARMHPVEALRWE